MKPTVTVRCEPPQFSAAARALATVLCGPDWSLNDGVLQGGLRFEDQTYDAAALLEIASAATELAGVQKTVSEAVEIDDYARPNGAEATWSKDAPANPGHFWFRPSDLTQFKQVVHVSRNSIGNLRASVGGGAFYPVEELKGLWYSEPIREPGGER